MKIYILERDNPQTRPNPQVFTDVRYANLVMKNEYRETMLELDITSEDAESGMGDYGCFESINEETLCGNLLITDDYSADRWEWRLTEHELTNHPDVVLFCPQCRSVIEGVTEPTSSVGAREWVMSICDAVEDVLEEYDVTIPDEDRTGERGEARLYGMAFDKVADAVTDILAALEAEMKMNNNQIYDFAVY